MASSSAVATRASAVRLRPHREDDELAARKGHEALREDDFTFLLGIEQAGSWNEWLPDITQHRRGLNLSPGLVPGARTIEKCGGVLEGVLTAENGLTKIRRYWID